MCRVKGMGGFESSARGWAKPVLQSLLGEGAIFGAHVRFAGPVSWRTQRLRGSGSNTFGAK